VDLIGSQIRPSPAKPLVPRPTWGSAWISLSAWKWRVGNSSFGRLAGTPS